MLVRRGKYSVADPLFVEERRPVLVARKLRRGAEAGDIVLVNAREKNRSLRGEVTRVIGASEDPRNVYEALFASIGTSREFPRKVDEEAEVLIGRLEEALVGRMIVPKTTGRSPNGTTRGRSKPADGQHG